MKGIAGVISDSLIPPSIKSMCNMSLQVIQDASSNQILAAVEHNKHEINRLLVQLLAITFISQNKSQIEKDLASHDNDNENKNNDTNHNNKNNNNTKNNCNNNMKNKKHSSPNPYPTSQGFNMRQYCEGKLLKLSPILGFSRKNYFSEYKISNDIRMEIISYLKPLEIHKNIVLINKQFNNNIYTMHQSFKHSHVFVNKHYVFETFTKLKKYCDNHENDHPTIDWEFDYGQWIIGRIESIDTQVHVRAVFGGQTVRATVGCCNTAPPCTMAFRPANVGKFVNILKKGYCSETCDVNLKHFCCWSERGCIHLTLGEIQGQPPRDVWHCGWIDFDWTLREVNSRNEDSFWNVSKDSKYNRYSKYGGGEEDSHGKISMVSWSRSRSPSSKMDDKSDKSDNSDVDSSDEKSDKNKNKDDKDKDKGKEEDKSEDGNNENRNKKRKKDKTGKNGKNGNGNGNGNGSVISNGRNGGGKTQRQFRLFQVRVTVDVTDAYLSHPRDVQDEILRVFHLNEINGRYSIALVFHVDDIDNFTYFGHKTDILQQRQMKHLVYEKNINSLAAGRLIEAKRQLLDAVGYPNYCMVTPDGVFSGMEKKDTHKKFMFDKWNKFRQCPVKRENECMTMCVKKNGLKKVYYDRENDELCIKVLPWYELNFEDESVPKPLLKRYVIPNGNSYRLVKAVITDDKLIKKFEIIMIKDGKKKEEKYFELLKEWKGYIRVSVDITHVFNEFQEMLKNEVVKYRKLEIKKKKKKKKQKKKTQRNKNNNDNDNNNNKGQNQTKDQMANNVTETKKNSTNEKENGKSLTQMDIAMEIENDEKDKDVDNKVNTGDNVKDKNDNNKTKHGEVDSLEIEWDNRKYFLDNRATPFVRYNRDEDKITHDMYVLLDSQHVYDYHAKFDFFSVLRDRTRQDILHKVFEYCGMGRQDRNSINLVCKQWLHLYRILLFSNNVM